MTAVVYEDLRHFKKRVDKMLDHLEGSDADPEKIGHERLKATQIGHGFSEAEDLMSAYTYVHDQLSTLSRSLADQIEAMSISLHIAHAGLSNVDVDTRNRLVDLNDAAKDAYDPELDPNAKRAHGPAVKDHPHDTAGTGGTG